MKENQLKKIPNLQPLFFFFQGTQRRVRNSRGKRAISVRATEVLLYIDEIPEIFCLTPKHRRKLLYAFL